MDWYSGECDIRGRFAVLLFLCKLAVMVWEMGCCYIILAPGSVVFF